MAEQWLSIVEYARTFGISDMTIRRRIRTGRIQAALREGKYYIPVDTDPSTGEPLRHGNRTKVAQAPANVMKAHPSAERTITVSRAAPAPERQPSQAREYPRNTVPQNNPWNLLPQHIATAIASQPDISVEARALLDYCNNTLGSSRERERLVEAKFSAQIETLTEQLRHRDAEIQKLKQQVEDLQFLVQILEKKKG